MAKKTTAKQQAETTSVADGTPRRSTAGNPREGVGLPEIVLAGGPYDGAIATASDESQILGVSFLPDHLVVNGKKGSCVYDLERTDEGQRGVFSHYG